MINTMYVVLNTYNMSCKEHANQNNIYPQEIPAPLQRSHPYLHLCKKFKTYILVVQRFSIMSTNFYF